MFIKIIGVLAIILLSGCATSGEGEGGNWSKNHSFSLNNGSEFSFQTSGCNITGAKLQNRSGKSISMAAGNLVVSNSNSNNTIDAYFN